MENILIHGLEQEGFSWLRTIMALEENGELDCPNLYELIQDQEVNYSNLYQAFSENCNDCSEPLNLCGISLGGTLALQYAIEYPKRVNSLVLIATQYIMPKKMLTLQNIIFRFMPASTFKRIGLKKKDMFKLLRSMRNLNFQQDLNKINCPVLILCGEKDKVNMQASLQLQQQIFNAQFMMIEHAGHEINIDAPESLGKVLNHFWRYQC